MRSQTATHLIGQRATVTPAGRNDFPAALLAELGTIYRKVNTEMAGALWLVSEAGKDGLDAMTIAKRLQIPYATAQYHLKALGRGGMPGSVFAEQGMGLVQLAAESVRPKPYTLTQKGRLLINRVNKEA